QTPHARTTAECSVGRGARLSVGSGDVLDYMNGQERQQYYFGGISPAGRPSRPRHATASKRLENLSVQSGEPPPTVDSHRGSAVKSPRSVRFRATTTHSDGKTPSTSLSSATSCRCASATSPASSARRA